MKNILVLLKSTSKITSHTPFFVDKLQIYRYINIRIKYCTRRIVNRVFIDKTRIPIASQSGNVLTILLFP